MCGIAGIVMRDPDARVEQTLLKKMADALAHRGPDGEGYYRDGPAGLASRRLAIVDKEHGQQPLFNSDATAALVFNGEIYNYLDVRERLHSAGEHFRTRTDGEVIVHAYSAWGLAQCIDSLRGMFAFAIWDEKARTLHLVRDRLGLKPLHYILTRDFFAFASEIKALLAVPGIDARPSYRALDEMLTYNFVLGDRTVFQDIYQVPPGHIVSFALDTNRLRRTQYWDAPWTDAIADDNPDAFRDVLTDAVLVRRLGDDPVGLTLSGGVDSSSLAALLAGAGDRPHAFTVAFDSAPPDERWDESARARLVADHFGLAHDIVRCGNELAALPQVIRHLEAPQRWAGTTALLKLFQHIRASTQAILSGEGADEVFAGYPHLRLFEQASDEFPHADALSVYFATLRDMDDTRKQELYTPAFCEAIAAEPEPLVTPSARVAELSKVRQAMYYDMKYRLPGFVLLTFDRLSMAASVEARAPFLDQRLLEAGPWAIAGDKTLLRAAMTGALPESILARPKQGFVEPGDAWLREALPAPIAEVMAAPELDTVGLFRSDIVVRDLDRHRADTRTHGLTLGEHTPAYDLMGVISAQLWVREFLGKSAF